MREPNCDVIVVGGGPAGCLAAILLGRAGYTVNLYDQSLFPREKPCGEGLLPPGVEVLSAHGLLTTVGGKNLRGVRYHVDGESVHSDFGRCPSGQVRFGLGQRRSKLDQALWKEAIFTPRVRANAQMPVVAPLVEEGRVSGVQLADGPKRARLVVAADGACSTIRRKLGLERTLEPRRVGIRAHFRLAAGKHNLDDIQVFLRKGYELYLTPLPGNEVLVAALAHADASKLGLSQAFYRWVGAERCLVDWLEGSSQSSELAGRAPLLKKTTRKNGIPGLVLLGDAAESVDPVTAAGMSLALGSASLLAGFAQGILEGSARARRAFERRRSRALLTHRVLGAGLRFLGKNPLAASTVKGLVQVHPETMDILVSMATRRAD